ncbi:two-component system response regulator [Brevundimonas sp.]|uniref:response regulator n=1 Tax=Brevundimonas sp. TaxID=1871086 RepID=UPI003568DB9A
MFALDSRLKARLKPVIGRVLIVDSYSQSARLLVDIMKGMGSGQIVVEPTEARAMKTAVELEPGLVLTERGGQGLNGESLARAWRRSHMSCRRVPIIMVTADATATSIIGARDAGIHEFLRKPFTSADLLKRVDNVALKPRDWVEAVGYVGPDRRRFNSGEFSGSGKRKSDKAAKGADLLAENKDQAMRILASALDQFDSDPPQATRAIREQAANLKAVALKLSDSRLVAAVGVLEVSLATGPASKETLSVPIGTLLTMHQAAAPAAAA